jgi:hypothetical protein
MTPGRFCTPEVHLGVPPIDNRWAVHANFCDPRDGPQPYVAALCGLLTSKRGAPRADEAREVLLPDHPDQAVFAGRMQLVVRNRVGSCERCMRCAPASRRLWQCARYNGCLIGPNLLYSNNEK